MARKESAKKRTKAARPRIKSQKPAGRKTKSQRTTGRKRVKGTSSMPAHRPTNRKNRRREPSPKSPVLMRDIAVLRKELASLRSAHKNALERETELRRMLEVDSRSKKGDKTVVRELLDRVDSLENYLLNNTKRIENILTALKTHRDYLIKLNRKTFASTPKDIMRSELAIMNNTLGILALNGIKVSEDLLRDIRKLELDMKAEDAKFGDLQRRKEELEGRFHSEIGQYDLEGLFSKKKEIYGYR